MKKCQYILFSAILSLLIIYLGVGMPIVQYRCMSCIDTDSRTPLLAVVEVSESKCTCGCADKDNQEEGCGACATKKECCCGTENTTTDEGETDGTEQGADGPCSQVRIEKINLPTLASSVHLDNVVFPVINLLFYNFLINTDLLSAEHDTEYYTDTSMHKLRPRGYLSLMCTLLI